MMNNKRKLKLNTMSDENEIFNKFPFISDDIPYYTKNFNIWIDPYKDLIINSKPENMTKDEYIGILYKFGFSSTQLSKIFSLPTWKIQRLLKKENIIMRIHEKTGVEIDLLTYLKNNLPFDHKDIIKNSNIFHKWIENKKMIIKKIRPKNVSKRKYICELYKFGFTEKNISIIYNCSRGAIQAILNSNNVIKRKPSPRKRIFFNEDFFEVLDNKYNCYWYGIMLADGCVSNNGNSISLNSSAKDKEHLEKFARCMNCPENTIKCRKSGRNKGMAILNITSRKMKEDLKRHGCVPRKTFIVELPKNLPDELMKHVVRGYFDGDGHIGTNKQKNKSIVIRIIITSGSKKILEQIQEFFSRYKIKNNKIYSRKNANCYTIAYSNINVYKIYNLINCEELQLYRKLTYYKELIMLQVINKKPQILDSNKIEKLKKIIMYQKKQTLTI